MLLIGAAAYIWMRGDIWSWGCAAAVPRPHGYVLTMAPSRPQLYISKNISVFHWNGRSWVICWCTNWRVNMQSKVRWHQHRMGRQRIYSADPREYSRQMLLDLSGMGAAKDDDVLYSRWAQQFQSVVQQRDVHQRQQALQTQNKKQCTDTVGNKTSSSAQTLWDTKQEAVQRHCGCDVTWFREHDPPPKPWTPQCYPPRPTWLILEAVRFKPWPHQERLRPRCGNAIVLHLFCTFQWGWPHQTAFALPHRDTGTVL